MLKTVKVRCVNGALAPLEPLDLDEGAEYLITLNLPPPPGANPPPSSAGAWRQDGAYWEETLHRIYEARRAGSRTPPEQ